MYFFVSLAFWYFFENSTTKKVLIFKFMRAFTTLKERVVLIDDKLSVKKYIDLMQTATDYRFKDPHTTKKYYTFIIHYTGVYFNNPKSEISVPQPSVDGLFTGLFSIIVFLIKFVVISIPTAAYISVRMQKRPGKSPNRFRIPLLIFL